MTEIQKDAAWQNAIFVSDDNEKKGYRKDMCGAWINRNEYDNDQSPYGWHVDHIYPKAGNGVLKSIDDHEEVDNHANLQAMHIKNNSEAGKGNEYPTFTAVVEANGVDNVPVPYNQLEDEIPEDKQDELQKLYDL